MTVFTRIGSRALIAAMACTAPAVPPPDCEPGAAVECSCPGDRAGTQTCSSDGASYSVCSCGANGGGPGGGSGGGATGASGGAGGGSVDAGSSQAPVSVEGGDLLAFRAAVEACRVPEAGRVTITTRDDMRAALIGIWASCSGPHWTQRSDECGQEFTSGGEWHLLTCAQDGTLVRHRTPGLSGIWKLLPNPVYQVNLYPEPDHEKILLPAFSATPHKMTLWPDRPIWARGH